MTNRPLVCLLRAPASSDPYEQAMEAAGYHCVSVPVLQFTFINENVLVDALATPDVYAGLIMTSPRGAEALAQVWSHIRVARSTWQAKPVYVVGQRTAEAVGHLGLTPMGEETGDADALAKHIARRHFTAPLLFLCGNRRRDVLPLHLQKARIACTELCVYETHLRKDLEIPTLPSINWMVFFSPSGVEAIEQSGIDVQPIRKAAIGPTTAEAIKKAGWVVDAIAAMPTPEALVAALRKATAGIS